MEPHPAAPAAAPPRALFAAAVFLGAFLLFWVQPLFGKAVLPLLGGTPAAWGGCLLFFQAALLAGYLYAHALARWLPPRAQVAVHLALLAAAAATLPVRVGAAPPDPDRPLAWLLGTMALSLGPPFVALAATAPLLGRWFARAAPARADPYPLYAASNLGSLGALLAFPFLLEARLTLGEQGVGWAAAFAAFALLAAACAARSLRGRRPPDGARPAPAPAPRARERLAWVLLALVPSALLLSVTGYATTDVAPVPLLWVVPLALYLATFVVAFAGWGEAPRRWTARVELVLVGAALLQLVFGLVAGMERLVALHLAAFTAVSLACHGELARRRPPVARLTGFYLWIAFGGMLGGALLVVVAPAAFPLREEYPLLLVAALLLRPRPAAPAGAARPRRETAAVAALTGALVLLLWGEALPLAERPREWAAAALFAGALLGFARSPLRLGLAAAAMLAGPMAAEYRDPGLLRAERSFYGAFRVVARDEAGPYHALYHGSTLHGVQSRLPALRREPMSYYVRTGPVGQALAGLPRPARPRRVAVLGLGAGTLAAYAAPGEAWTFYEIDPHVARVAADPRYFTYLSDAEGRARVALGDGRIGVSRAPAGAFDLLFVDAFASDAVPVHLLTREALATYLDRLAPGGAMVFNLSNRYVDLEPVLAALAAERGLAGRVGRTTPHRGPLGSHSTWAVLARRPADLGALAADPRWEPLRGDPAVGPWTDDFSNLWSVFRRPGRVPSWRLPAPAPPPPSG